MKRIYLLGLFLTLLTTIGFQAKAEFSVTLTWDEPGMLAPKVKLGGSDEIVEVSSTATSQTFTTQDTWGSLYVWPSPDYTLEPITIDGTTITPQSYITPPDGVLDYKPVNGMNIDLKTYNGQTIHLDLTKIVRDKVLTVNVVNGLANINKFSFKSGYAPKLQQGRNTVYYSPTVDGPLTVQFAGNGAESKPFKFTLNSEEPGNMDNDPFRIDNDYTHLYIAELDPDVEDNYMYIQVFENNEEEPDKYDVKVVYGNGMEGCLTGIYNRTLMQSYNPSDYEDGIITGVDNLIDGTELLFNFRSDDFTVTQILVNGVDKTSDLENEGDNINQSFVLTVTEDMTVTINGTVTQWADIDYYGYISDPEGVEFSLDMTTYDLTYQVVNENIGGNTYGVLTMPAGSKEIKLSVSQKNNKGRGTFYFKPKEGYFITLCYFGTPNDSEKDGTRTVNSGMGADQDGNTFYMIVEKLAPAYTANLNVVDTSGYPETTSLKGADTYSNQNDNPAQKVVVLSHDNLGESEFSFIPNYDNPFTLYLNQSQTAKVYLDGGEVSGKTNTDTNQTEYALPLYAPAEGESSDIHSDIQVYFTGAPTMSNAIMNLENNAEAEFYYSPVMHEANAEGQSVIRGTTMYVKPTSAKAVVLYKGVVQQLDENGLFSFVTGSAADDNTVTVTGPKSIKIAGMVPKSGSVVKSLNSVKIIVPMTVDEEEVNLDSDTEVLSQTVITHNGSVVATLEEVGEPEFDDATQKLYVPLTFNTTLTAAGEDYLVNVPDGAFVQKEWDDAEDGFVVVPGGYITAAYNGRFDIDPNLAAPAAELSYESGSTLTKPEDLGTIYILYPEATTAEINYNIQDPITLTESGDAADKYSEVGALTVSSNLTRAGGVTVVATFDPAPTKVAEYSLVMKEGAVTLDGYEESPAIDKVYTKDTVTGVFELFADESGNVTVYTVDGKVVLENVPADELRGLKKGLYIINGKKTLVK